MDGHRAPRFEKEFGAGVMWFVSLTNRYWDRKIALNVKKIRTNQKKLNKQT